MTLATAALSPAYDPGSWDTFFTLTGAAAATLTGLFFLAFSLRLQDLQLSRVIRTRARYLLIWLIAIAVSSAFVVMPGQSLAALAAEILALTAGCVAYTAWSALRSARWEPSAFSVDLVGRWLGMGATWLLSIGAGISLLAGHGGGLYLLAFAVLLGIALEVAAAWSLVVWVGKDTRGQDIMPERQRTPEPPQAGQLGAERDGSRAAPGQLPDPGECQEQQTTRENACEQRNPRSART
jgi:hypothetical protein